MFLRIGLALALLAATSAQSQVGASATGVDTNIDDESQMPTPPPVSGANYPANVGSAARSNYLLAGWTANTAYSDNVLAGFGGAKTSDVSYSIWPTIAFDKVTSLQHWTINYSPGFTIYQHTSALNQANQNLAVDAEFRLSPHVTAELREGLQKTSNVLNQPNAVSGGAISGSIGSPQIALIVPAANQLSNNANAELTYQFSRNGMIGATGLFTNLHYLNSTQSLGLSDSSSSGGSAFYNHRLTQKHYVGATYQYSRILTDQAREQTTTLTNSLLLFYTIYVTPTISFSVSVGPQHFDISQALAPAYRSWSPTATASMGWQQPHTNIAISYERTVTSGGGLAGAFLVNSVQGSALWRLARTWNASVSGGYSNEKNIAPSTFASSQGGEAVSGTFSAQHRIGERLNLQFGYTRLYQSYAGIQAIAADPNTNREFLSLTYQLTRPIGR